MFWGAAVAPGKPYTYTPPPGEPVILHVSQASCDVDAKVGARVALVCESEGTSANLCVLTVGASENASLDIMLQNEATFSVKGKGTVHISGYMLPDDEDIDSDEFDTDSEDEDDSDDEAGLVSPWGFFDGDDDEGDGDDSEDDYDGDDYDSEDDEPKPASGVKIEEIDEEDEEDDEDDDEEPDEDEVRKAMEAAAAEMEAKEAKAKKAKKAQAEKEAKAAAEKEKKAAKKRAASEATAAEPAAKKGKAAAEAPEEAGVRTRRFESGLEIKYLKAGKPNGKVATAGRRVGMRYVGKLTNGKQFDASGKRTFTFRLGVGEVIKGWDAGVQGMKVGEKRRLTVPPKLGYGAKGAPPTIPGNATLIFDVECVEVR